jgi:hypothetical protein
MKIIDVNGNERECVNATPDKNFPGYMKIEFKSKIRKGYHHSEWYEIDQFVKNNPQLSHLAKGAPQMPKEDLGSVTSATKTSLTDKKKKWKVNEFAGNHLWISRGKGEAQTRRIISNTKNTLKIDRPWREIPDQSSQYVISINVHEPKVMGATLPGYQKKSSSQKRKRKSAS